MHRSRKLGALAVAVLASLVLAAPALAFTYPPAVRTSFVRTCSKTGGTPKVCKCVISYLEKHESLKQFVAQSKYNKNGHLSALESKAVKACT